MSPPLVGRAAELRRLQAAFFDPDTAIVAIRGPSGAGKTALARAAAALTPGLLFGEGRYAVEGGGVGPVLEGLARLVEQALDLLYDPRAGAASLTQTLGIGLDVLRRAGFAADRDFLPAPISAPKGPAPGSAAIAEAALRVVRWLAGFGTPMALFIDDWTRAPPQAHALVRALAGEPDRGALTVLLTEQDGPSRPRDSLGADEIDLPLLDPDERIRLLGEAFGDYTAGPVIAAWLGTDLPTLPFDLVEVARSLAVCRAVEATPVGWVLRPTRAADVARVDVAHALVRSCLEAQPDHRRLVLACALFQGDISPSTAAAALGASEPSIRLQWANLVAGGLMAQDQPTVSFRHDRLCAATIELAERAELADLAAEMAESLARADLDPDSLDVVLNLRFVGGVGDISPARWRDLFAVGSERARGRADLDAAARFADAAWRLRERETPQSPAADRLILREAALAAAARGDPASAARRSSELIRLSENDDQLAEAYELAIHAARLAGDADGALRWAVVGLRACGVTLPRTPGPGHMFAAALAWCTSPWLGALRRRLGRARRSAGLARLASACGSTVFEREPAQSFLVALKASTIARRSGDDTDIWRMGDVFILSALQSPVAAARLAAAPIPPDKRTGVLRAATLYRQVYFGDVWRKPVVELRRHCAEVYDLALAEGDMATAGLAVRQDVLMGWRCGVPLDVLAVEVETARSRAERLGHATLMSTILALARLVDNLRGVEVGLAFTEELLDAVPTWAKPEARGAIGILELEALSLKGAWARVLTQASQLRALGISMDAHPGGLIWRFHESLARLKLGTRPPRGAMQRLRAAARLNQADNAHRELALRAEQARCRGDASRCLGLFGAAMEAAGAAASRLEALVVARCAWEAAEAFNDAAAAQRYRAAAAAWATAWGWREGDAPRTVDAPSSPEVERRSAEAQVAAAMAERAERAKARLLADVAHELRTPLQGLQGMIDLAATGSEPLHHAELSAVLASLRSVVDDLADLGAHAAHGAVIAPRPIDLIALCRAEVAMARTAPDNADIRFEELIPGEPPVVLADGARVRQVLRNLLSNASKYGEGGPVHVRLGTTDNGIGQDVTLTVEDSGPGLRDSDMPRLFEPFDRAGREDGRGLGLGLALARGIAERLGGTLTAENRAEGGARFTFCFPVLTAAVDPSRSPQGNAATTSPLRILVVEDIDLSRRVISAMLRTQGHEVIEAADGGQALEAVGHRSPHLVLMDLGLPDMDGLKLLVGLQQGLPEVPVIVLTASTSTERLDAALAAGAVRVLLKPVSGEELAEAIAGLSSTETPASSAFSEQIEALAEGARVDILNRSRALLTSSAAPTAFVREAHRLAGLAGQFGANEVAAAASSLERVVEQGGRPSEEALDRLRAALDAMAARVPTPAARHRTVNAP